MDSNVPKPDTNGGWKSAKLHPYAGYNRPREYGASPDRGMPLYGFSQGPRYSGGQSGTGNPYSMKNLSRPVLLLCSAALLALTARPGGEPGEDSVHLGTQLVRLEPPYSTN